jgi:hypothetical protein
MDGGFSVVSSDSSYTLELQQTRNGVAAQPAARTGDWREQLQRNYLVKRGEGGGVEGGKKRRGEKELNKNSIQLLPLDHSSPHPAALSASASHVAVPTRREDEERKELIAALVKERAKADGIRDLIGQCYNCAAVGSWGKLRRRFTSPSLPTSPRTLLTSPRDLSDVLQDCHDFLSDHQEGQQGEHMALRRHNLVTELVNYPEVYDALSHLLAHPRSVSPPHQHQQQPESLNDQQHQGQEEEQQGGGGREGEDAAVATKLSAREGRERRRKSGPPQEVTASSLGLSEDVLRYFQEERSRREEQELDERGRRVFGSR